MTDCLLLRPKLRGSGETFSSLGAGLGKAKSLRLALCNLDTSGTVLRDAIRDIFSARGVSDATTAADAFVDPAHPSHAHYKRVDVKAPPEETGSGWSVLGQAAAGRLQVAAFKWDDDGDGLIAPGELTFFNPLPYFEGLIPAAGIKEQVPTLANFEIEASSDPAFATASTHAFDLGTGDMTVPTPIGGFLRFRLKLDVHDVTAPDGPTVAPYEIAYELRSGATVRSAGVHRINAFKPTDATAIAGRLYHTTGSSTPASHVYWLQLPIDPASSGTSPTPSNASTPTIPNTLDLGTFPPGSYDLIVRLRSALQAAPWAQTFHFVSSGGVAVSLDVDGNGVTTDAVDGWDSYLPGFEGSTTRIDDADPQNMKVFVTGVAPGASVAFSLTGTTDWTGINGNITAGGFPNGSTDPDFVLNDGTGTASPTGTDTAGPVTRTADAAGKAWVWLRCRDYAASTTVEVSVGGGAPITRLLPKNSDASASDHLPDAWESLFGVDLSDTSDGDVDLAAAPPHHIETGDGLSAFEEYRGFRIVDPASPTDRLFQRTNQMIDATPGVAAARHGGPLKKDVFVADTGGVPPFATFGHGFSVFELSWHLVDPVDKGDVSALFLAESGRINRNTDPGLKVQDQFALLIRDVALAPNILGSAGALEWNDTAAATFDLGNIDGKMARFSITPPDAKIDTAKKSVLAHEIGHRQTLRHLLDRFTLDTDDVKTAGSAPEPGQKAILVDGASKLQVRLKIQRRSDSGHVDEGYTTEIVAYGPVSWGGLLPTSGSVAFTAPLARRFIWEVASPPDPLAELEATEFEIPDADITVVTAGTPVEVSDVLFDFKTSATGLIADVKAGTKTAQLLIWRGHTSLMDAKIVEQDPQFGLVSASPTSVNLFELIQIKSARAVVGPFPATTTGEHGAF